MVLEGVSEEGSKCRRAKCGMGGMRVKWSEVREGKKEKEGKKKEKTKRTLVPLPKSGEMGASKQKRRRRPGMQLISTAMVNKRKQRG